MKKHILEAKVKYAIDALQSLADQGYRVEDDEQLTWKDKFDELRANINNHLIEASALYDDMKANGLSFGAIEAEGYLRSARTLANIANDIAEEI